MSRKLNFKSARKCQECGKEFVPKSGTQKYCPGPHYTECIICGKEIEYSCSPKEKPLYCSPECRKEGKRRTVQERYGVNNVSQLQSVKDKISQMNSSNEVDKKRRQTCIRNWGVDNPAKNSNIRKKMSEKMQSDEYLEGRKQTCLKRYGVESPMQTQEVKDKRAQTCLDRYGMTGHPAHKQFFSLVMIDPDKVDEYLEFKSNPKDYIILHYKDKPTIRQLENDLGCTNTPIYEILNQNDCIDMIQHCFSNMEQEVYDFILSLDSNIKIKRNDRTLIKPLEIDLYLPDFKLGIECNPASTHNSSRAWLGDDIKPYDYHQMKSSKCQEKGIFLFHIFGYEWNIHKNIIKSMIVNLLHKSTYHYGGRQTYVCEISHEECRAFLLENHRQGYTSSKIRLGLRLKSTDELISVMTFNHMRPTIGKTQDLTEEDWELSRFCTKLYTNVSGGASKLFKYFLKVYHPCSVISFSDIAHTKGDLYKSLGFQYVSKTSPSYVWCDIYDSKYYHRVSCQKKNLKHLLKDANIDLNQTEKQIMESHGYVRIYDSGVIKWRWFWI